MYIHIYKQHLPLYNRITTIVQNNNNMQATCLFQSTYERFTLLPIIVAALIAIVVVVVVIVHFSFVWSAFYVVFM